ncbi:MAG TPA: tRNA (adenosine(37)-N6)-threonylcarbamoyltransferase complex ATPase subunit type 1 TsaE [Candidatus Nanoarchaeia archaeon]|nr:tRNA (adenosine(37)-N6)-threonylcarbamoyltransferase complex ATPase subunit type 1 TsaE [Candidatus Nanoarchaeia archaeon]
MKIITHSEKETIALAKKIAKKAKGGEVYALSGELGAGKTVFARGFASGLGIKRNINSPTFVLMKIYPVRKHPAIRHLCHIDAYRLKSAKDLEAIGAADYLGRKDSVCLVEWPEKIKKLLPEKVNSLKLKHLAEDQREIVWKK